MTVTLAIGMTEHQAPAKIEPPKREVGRSSVVMGRVPTPLRQYRFTLYALGAGGKMSHDVPGRARVKATAERAAQARPTPATATVQRTQGAMTGVVMVQASRDPWDVSTTSLGRPGTTWDVLELRTTQANS